MATPLAEHRARIAAWAERCSLGDRATAQLLELAEPCLGFTSRRASVPVGGTKLGGAPDLPAHVAWPRNGDQALTFMAQLDLAEVARLLDSPLPPRGLLSFFFDRSEIHEGREVARVLHSVEPVARRTTPGELEQFEECALDLTLRTSLPELGAGSAYGALFMGAQQAALSSISLLLEELGNTGSNHQLLGYPCGMQGDPLLQRVSTDDELPANTREVDRCRDARRYRQLLGIDTDDHAGIEWIDMGTLWFLIEETELARADFSRVTTVLQFC